MVIEDFSNTNYVSDAQKSVKTGVKELVQLARPLDRLAALVFDVIAVLMPIILLATSPIRQSLMFSRLTLNEDRLMLSGILIAVVTFVIVTMYFTFMNYYWSATLGKLLFNLRIRDIWSHKKPDFSQALTRSLLLILEACLFFIPSLTVFTNIRRRTWHDRLSDTIVVTGSKRFSLPPGLQESSLVKGFLSAIVVFIACLGLLESYKVFEDFSNQNRIFEMMEADGDLCASVGHALKDYSLDEHTSEDRLSTAMALFAAGIASKSCLTKEVEYLVNKNEKLSALSYLALAFVHSDKSELSNSYLDKVCQADQASDSCLMSKVVAEWSDEKWDKVDEIFNAKTGPAENHLMIWAIRHYMKHGKFEQALKYIDKLAPQESLSSFITVQRAKALWGLGRQTESRAVVAVAMDVLDQADRLDLAGWMCFEEVDQDCSGTGQLSCRVMDKALTQSSDFMLDPRVALTTVRSQECSGKVDYEKLTEQIPSEDGKKLVKALNLFKNHADESALSEIKNLAEDEDADADFRLEAKHRLISWSKSTKDLEPMVADWQKSNPGFDWVRTGKALFKTYLSIGKNKEAKDIGEKLLAQHVNDPEVLKGMVVSLLRVGDKKLAWSTLNKYQEQLINGADDSRQPASSDAFSQAVKTLKNEYLGK